MLKEEHAGQGISPVERLNTLVAADMKAADRLIHKGMASSVELIPDLARHLIESGGKRLRPLLTLAAAIAGGYRGEGHIRLAAAVEFIHTATLLHDDVVDESTLRRGKVSANLVWGNKPPVLVGDLVSFYTSLVKIGTTSLTVRVTVDVARGLAPHNTMRVTQAEIVYVALDEAGTPVPVRQT